MQIPENQRGNRGFGNSPPVTIATFLSFGTSLAAAAMPADDLLSTAELDLKWPVLVTRE